MNIAVHLAENVYKRSLEKMVAPVADKISEKKIIM